MSFAIEMNFQRENFLIVEQLRDDTSCTVSLWRGLKDYAKDYVCEYVGGYVMIICNDKFA